jgi:phenylacetic acid degradation operon negative regulatory protein
MFERDAVRFVGRLDSGDVRTLVDQFAVDEWARRARGLEATLDDTVGGLVGDSADTTFARAFYALAATLQHVRVDPLLPAAMLPRDWPGARLRSAYRNHQARFDGVVSNWSRAAAPGEVDSSARR